MLRFHVNRGIDDKHFEVLLFCFREGVSERITGLGLPNISETSGFRLQASQAL